MIPLLPGFRDFYPEECARRNHVVSVWRAVAGRYGFVEYDGPTMESAELYRRKNEPGAEILQQLYAFQDRGDREVALRPEMTPTFARMIAARGRDYRKPIKWFCVSNFFRYERKQRGRLREFLQFNADLVGDASPEADAEVIALSIDLLRSFGFTEKDIVVRLSDRRAWSEFLQGRGCDEAMSALVLSAVDKLGREPDEAIHAKLQPSGVGVEEVRAFIQSGAPGRFDDVLGVLKARGLGEYVETDLSIVRGLNYYTGVVFEVFDRAKSLRALAGGGRYDNLIGALSEGGGSQPAIGFGMGDVVLSELVDATPHAAALVPKATACDLYVVIAEERLRGEAQRLVQRARDRGWRVDYPLKPAKVGRQFQDAGAAGALFAVVVGDEWPSVKWKDLSTRAEVTLDQDGLANRLENPDNFKPAAGTDS